MQSLVSCITPTYGRYHLLTEMYWCWNNQTYENKELIIVNDQFNLKLFSDDPRVKIFNFDERFSGLGSKRNYCIEQVSSDSEYILPFDDDDLFFPEHISSLVEGFVEHPECHRTRNSKHIIVKDNSLTGIMNNGFPFFGASCLKANIMKSSKFSENFMSGEDIDWMSRNNIITHTISYKNPTFVYRSGMGVVHASGHKLVGNDVNHQKYLNEKIINSVPKLDKLVNKKLVPEISEKSLNLYKELTYKRTWNALQCNP